MCPTPRPACNGQRALQIASAEYISNRIGLTAVYGLWDDMTAATKATDFVSQSTASWKRERWGSYQTITCVTHPERTQKAMPMVPVDLSNLENVYLDLTP